MKHSAEDLSRIEVTQLLKAWGNGDGVALEKLAPLVHNELHRLAHKYMNREKVGHMLQTTALVNEVYLRLLDMPQITWQDRAHFFAISARMMRRILTDFARSANYQKRGGAALHVSFDEALIVSKERYKEILAIDDALKELEVLEPRKSQVVELRFFGGLSVEETAEVLKISPATVKRDWNFAKGWLYRALRREQGHQSEGLAAG